MMQLRIEHRFQATGKAAPECNVHPGAWFSGKGYERAMACTDVEEAKKILADTFKGPDSDGITLSWNPIYFHE